MANLGSHLCFWLNGHESEVLMTPVLCSMNLLEKLTEFKEIFYLTDYWFTRKEYNSGTTSWERYIGHGMWGGPSPSTPLSPNFQVFAHRPGSSLNVSFGVLWRFHYTCTLDSIIGHRWWSQPPGCLSFPEVRWATVLGGTNSSNSLKSQIGSPGNMPITP